MFYEDDFQVVGISFRGHSYVVPKAMTIPTLTTDRLILRAHKLEDFPAFAAQRADPVVMKYIGKGDLLSEEDAWRNFRAS